MTNGVTFWEFTLQQRDYFITYAGQNGVNLTESNFIEYNGYYYIQQTDANLSAYSGLLFDFDDQDGPEGTYTFGEHFWSYSLVPPALWP